MGNNNLIFTIGDKVKIDGSIYVVEGLITFLNDADNYKWTEYKISNISKHKVSWLSIDSTYSEFAIYNTCRYSKDFSESGLDAKGYRETDYGNASVVESIGNVDTDIGDRVKYNEYEDYSEENLMAIETWSDEVEYSTGYYLDENEIEKLERDISYDYKDETESERQYTSYKNSGNNYGNGNNKALLIIGCIAVIFIIFGIGSSFTSFNSGFNSKKITDFINSSSYFTYNTSLTSDLDTKEKADVYSTSLSVEEAAKTIIDGIVGGTESVQDNAEDGSVAILTSDEYCLVYISEDKETLVQVSSRSYTYSSTHRPYRSRHVTGLFYRNYYYNRGYYNDTSRYKNYSNGYENYSGSTSNYNTENKYKTYSDSVRDSSVSSRPSSGGGTSSGK